MVSDYERTILVRVCIWLWFICGKHSVIEPKPSKRVCALHFMQRIIKSSSISTVGAVSEMTTRGRQTPKGSREHAVKAHHSAPPTSFNFISHQKYFHINPFNTNLIIFSSTSHSLYIWFLQIVWLPRGSTSKQIKLVALKDINLLWRSLRWTQKVLPC